MNTCDLKGKAVVFLGDGMADLPIPELGGKTPLEAVPTPTMDKIAANGASGTFLTLPEGFDTVALYDRALGAGVAYVAGSFFFLDGSHRNTMRLNFSFVAEEKMEPGMKLLGEIIKGRL